MPHGLPIVPPELLQRRALVTGAVAAVLSACGGGGHGTPELAPGQLPQLPGMRLVFVEAWEPRTAASGVAGTVSAPALPPLPPGVSQAPDPEQPFTASSISARWGTLAGLDGTSTLPDVTGVGPCAQWAVRDGRLHFHADWIDTGLHQTGGFALLSGQTFDPARPLVAQCDLALTGGTVGAFAELALIGGEGDYRGLAILRGVGGVDAITTVGPYSGMTLAARQADVCTLRLEYSPAAGWRYIVNGQVLGTEAADHLAARLSSPPRIGLYFVGHGPGQWAEGWVGPIYVWEGSQ